MKNIKKEIDEAILFYQNSVDSYNRPARYLYLSTEDMRLFKHQLVVEYGRSMPTRGITNLLENRFDYRGLKVIESSNIIAGEIVVSALLEKELINAQTITYYDEEML